MIRCRRMRWPGSGRSDFAATKWAGSSIPWFCRAADKWRLRPAGHRSHGYGHWRIRAPHRPHRQRQIEFQPGDRIGTRAPMVARLPSAAATLASTARRRSHSGSATRPPALVREYAGHERPVKALAFLAAGRQIVTLDNQGAVSVWEVATGENVRDLTPPGFELTSLTASADGKTIAAGKTAWDGAAAVYLWDAATGKLLHTLAGHTADVNALAFAPDGRKLASGGNATVRLWDVATGRELQELHGHARKRGDTKNSIRSLAFSPDGLIVASSSTDRSVRVWTVATGQLCDEMAAIGGTDALAFRDGCTLLVGSGNTLRRRDVAVKKLADYDGPTDWMSFLSFSKDGRRIITVDPDSTLRTWDAADETKHCR